MYALPQDIRDAAFGIEIPTGPNVDQQLHALIAKAEGRLAVALPMLASHVADGSVDTATVRGVVEDMVLRVVKNPRSLRTFGIDDLQATIDNSLSMGTLYVTDAERDLLTPASSTARAGFGSIRLGIPEWRLPRA